MIVAFDFDGIIVEDAFPAIGKPIMPIVRLIWQLEYMGVERILWTCRVGDRLKDAEDCCWSLNANFDAVNDNTPSNIAKYGNNPRKVFADIYVDDRMAGFARLLEGLSKYDQYEALAEYILSVVKEKLKEAG